MAKVFGFTGAHGTGKSTITRGIAERGLPYIAVDQRSMPRTVQQTWYPGLSLAEIVSDPVRYMTYQEHIIKEVVRQLDEHRARTDVEAVLVDRTAIDLYAYAATWSKQHGDKNIDWLRKYRTNCATALIGVHKIFIVPPRKFPFVAQPDRASEDTQKQNHEYIKSFLRIFMRPFKIVTPLAVDARVDFCIDVINKELGR